jgi:hypothetical protein
VVLVFVWANVLLLPGCALSKENKPPVFHPIENRIVAKGYAFAIPLEIIDPDDDPLTLEITNLPPGAEISGRPSEFIWIPQVVGIYKDIKISVSDGLTSVSRSFSIEVRAMPDAIQPPNKEVLVMNLVYYGQHNQSVDDRIIKAKPEYAIVNPPHGLWSEISGDNIFPGIVRYQESGIRLIGYLTAGYEGTHSGGNIESQWYSLETNLRLIKNMFELDKIDGIFIDECSSFPSANAKKYLKALTDLAHSYGIITWGNVGVANFDSWYFTDGGFDLMHSNENWNGQTLTAVQRAWAYRISVTGLDPNVTIDEAVKFTLDARAKGIGYCYVCPSYNSLPSWFEQYVDLLGH